MHESRDAGAQFGGIDAGGNGGTERGRLHEPVQQRGHAQLVHVRLHVDVVDARMLHFGVQLVVQKTHLHVGRQFGAPQQVFVRLVVGGAAHFNDFAVHLERRHDLVKHRLAQLGFHVFRDVLHPNARAGVVRVHQHARAVPSHFQILQQFQNVGAHEFGVRVHQPVEMRVLRVRVVVPRKPGERVAEYPQFHKVPQGLVHVKHHDLAFVPAQFQPIQKFGNGRRRRGCHVCAICKRKHN